MRTMIQVHHAACLVGHAVAVFLTPGLFPFYFAGVCALEIGSASCNIFCMYSSSRVAAAAYATIISVTHLVALRAMAGAWATGVHSRAARFFESALTLVLVYMRQKEAVVACLGVLWP